MCAPAAPQGAAAGWFQFLLFRGWGRRGRGIAFFFIFFGDGRGKWKSDLLLGRKDLPLSAAAPVLPCRFPNKVRVGKVSVIVQPRFHCFLLQRGGATALHALRRRYRLLPPRSLLSPPPGPPPPPPAGALGPVVVARRNRLPPPASAQLPGVRAAGNPVSGRGPSAAPPAPQRISCSATRPAAGSRLHLRCGPAAPRGAAAPRPRPAQPSPAAGGIGGSPPAPAIPSAAAEEREAEGGGCTRGPALGGSSAPRLTWSCWPRQSPLCWGKKEKR